MSVGLDIGTKSIKVVELEGEENNYTLKSSGVVGYRGESVDKLSDEKSIAVVSDIIAKLFSAAGISSKEVIIGLPESLAFTRTVKLPLLTDQEVAAAIKWEAEQYIPIPLKDAIIQHQIIERKEAGGAPGVSVLLVAAPRALVERYVSLVSSAKLNVVAVETELMALVRSLAPSEQTSIIIDFGARSLNLAIAKGGLLVFSRSIVLAGNALTRALIGGLTISEPQAEEYKKTYGLAASQLNGKVKGALEPVLRGIVDEIKKAIHFYQTEEKGDLPTSTIISGGTAAMPEISNYFKSMLGMEVLIANPFAKTKVPPEVWAKLAPQSPLYSIAVGLAMR